MPHCYDELCHHKGRRRIQHCAMALHLIIILFPIWFRREASNKVDKFNSEHLDISEANADAATFAMRQMHEVNSLQLDLAFYYFRSSQTCGEWRIVKITEHSHGRAISVYLCAESMGCVYAHDRDSPLRLQSKIHKNIAAHYSLSHGGQCTRHATVCTVRLVRSPAFQCERARQTIKLWRGLGELGGDGCVILHNKM